MFLEAFSREFLTAVMAFFIALYTLLTGTLMAVVPASLPSQNMSAVYATTTLPVSPSPLSKSNPSVQKISNSSAVKNQNTAVGSVSPVLSTSSPTGENSQELNDQTRAAVVNLLCTTNAGGYLHPISGSGVLIDSHGIILTNAHVAEYFLLRDYPTPGNVNCIVRTGSPAQPAYNAEVLYLPPNWISANASEITSQQPTGTGENDYAFLLITGSIDPSISPPDVFPFLTMSTDVSGVGAPVLLAAYPAGFIGGVTIEMNLYASSAFTTIQKLYSFGGSSVDVLSLGGSVLAQAGSSGGAVVSTDDGSLIGIITTDTASNTTAGRDLHAITLGHVDRSLQAEGLGGIDSFLSNNPVDTANVFNTTIAPELKQELINALQQH